MVRTKEEFKEYCNRVEQNGILEELADIAALIETMLMVEAPVPMIRNGDSMIYIDGEAARKLLAHLNNSMSALNV